MDFGIVEFLPDRSGHSCGYCKSDKTNISNGMWAHQLSVQNYQSLIDLGWRRSGCYCYKPIMNITCCPMYTIRCDALNFKLSKSQKKIIKRLNKFVLNGRQMCLQEDKDTESDCGDGEVPVSEAQFLETFIESDKEIIMKKLDINIKGEFKPCDIELSCQVPSEPLTANVTKCSDDEPTPAPPSAGCGRDPNRPLQKKAKLVRLERKLKKMAERGMSSAHDKNTCNTNQKSLEEFLNETLNKDVNHKLEIRLVQSSPASEEFKKTFNQELDLYCKYQTIIHKDPPSKISAKTFSSFLVDSPLQRDVNVESSDLPSGLGSYHHQYWLDEKLIAVGVIDILPLCVSSVYFFYDPDYSFLSLGTYSSLLEVALVRSLHRTVPEIKHYYMGFYIHSCPKMRYKARIGPAELLCPEAYSWHSLAECLPKLDKAKYSRLNEDPNAVSPETQGELNQILILWNQTAMRYSRFIKMVGKNVDVRQIKHYLSLVGKTCSQNMLLYPNLKR